MRDMPLTVTLPFMRYLKCCMWCCCCLPKRVRRDHRDDPEDEWEFDPL